jgi:hypothetical protein
MIASVHVEPCEVEPLRVELLAQQTDLCEQDSDARARHCSGDREQLIAEARQARRAALDELVQQACRLAPDGTTTLEGPVELLRSVLHAGLQTLSEDFDNVTREFVHSSEEPPPGGGYDVALLVAVARLVRAWTQTVADLDVAVHLALAGTFSNEEQHAHA